MGVTDRIPTVDERLAELHAQLADGVWSTLTVFQREDVINEIEKMTAMKRMVDAFEPLACGCC